MKKISLQISLYVVFFLSVFPGMATDFENWQQGVAVLDDRSVITGQMIVNEKHDILQILNNEKIQSIPAWKIRMVSLHDKQLGAVRRYLVIPSKVRSVELHQFYEVIIRGEVMLLASEKIFESAEKFNGSLVANLFPASAGQFANNQDFFFYDGKNLVPIEKFRKVVLPAFQQHFKTEIDSFIKEENLNKNFPKDQIRIMKYFNELYNEKLILAKG